MSQGIKHVEIAVSDLQKSLSFYDALFEIIGWQKAKNNGFVSGNTKVYVKQWDFPRGNTLGVRHLCFWADSRAVVDKVGVYVQGAGVKMIRGRFLWSNIRLITTPSISSTRMGICWK